MTSKQRNPIKIENGDFLLTLESAAILAGCSAPTLVRWGKEPDPPPKGSDGTYSAREFGKWLVESKSKKKGPGRPSFRGNSDEDEPGGRNAAEARLKLAQAIKAERENDIQEGLLLAREDVEEAWQTILMRVRSRFLKIPSTLARVVLGDSDIYSIEQKLKDAVTDALSEASEDWRDGVETEDT